VNSGSSFEESDWASIPSTKGIGFSSGCTLVSGDGVGTRKDAVEGGSLVSDVVLSTSPGITFTCRCSIIEQVGVDMRKFKDVRFKLWTMECVTCGLIIWRDHVIRGGDDYSCPACQLTKALVLLDDLRRDLAGHTVRNVQGLNRGDL
jgi:hypothetical protein